MDKVICTITESVCALFVIISHRSREAGNETSVVNACQSFSLFPPSHFLWNLREIADSMWVGIDGSDRDWSFKAASICSAKELI